MLKFDANISQLYTEHAFMDRFGAAAADGFKGVEFRAPYGVPAEAIAEQLQKHNLQLVLFNFPAGDWDAGERGIACLPGRHEEFERGLYQAISYAKALNCHQLNCLAGITPENSEHSSLEAALVRNLRLAAKTLAEHGIKLQLEVINSKDVPGCFVSTTDQFDRIHQKVGSDNLYLQFDFYHIQVMQGNLMANFERLKDRINHVQIADNPGRHEPGTGEINYDFIFQALAWARYDGWIGCEYIPRTTASEGLGWIKTHRLG